MTEETPTGRPTDRIGGARMRAPQDIYQDWLDVISAAMMAGEAETFADAVLLPFVMRTTAGVSVQETRAEVIADATNFMGALRSQGVTDYVRLVKRARYLREDVIEGWHRTHVLRRATNVVEPYGNRLILRRVDGVWKVSESDHELSGKRVPEMLLRSSPGAFEAAWAQAQADLTASYARAEPVYQVYLDALAACVMARDFEGWSGLFTLPHLFHYAETDHRIETVEALRPFFATLLGTLERLGADSMERHARHAEFLSGERILGYHDTTFHRHGTAVFGPVKSRMELVQSGGGWKCCAVTNSLVDDGRTDGRFAVTDELPTLRQIQERMKK